MALSAAADFYLSKEKLRLHMKVLKNITYKLAEKLIFYFKCF
jgi:hypothetical protein